jgi:hypothetical protein
MLPPSVLDGILTNQWYVCTCVCMVWFLYRRVGLHTACLLVDGGKDRAEPTLIDHLAQPTLVLMYVLFCVSFFQMCLSP